MKIVTTNKQMHSKPYKHHHNAKRQYLSFKINNEAIVAFYIMMIKGTLTDYWMIQTNAIAIDALHSGHLKQGNSYIEKHSE